MLSNSKSPEPVSWLLLRGLVREARHWGSFPETMAEALGHRIHTLDLQGVGTEHRRRAPLSIPEYAADLRARWLALQSDGSWGLVATSLGGMIALDWVTAHPEDFSRLVLINSSARNLAPPWQRFNLGFLPRVARAMISSDDRLKEQTALEMTTNLVDDRRQLAQEFAGYRQDAPISRSTFLRQFWAASRFRAPGQVEIPTLVLYSAGDQLVDPICSERLADLLGAERGVHATAGHDLPLDDPQWVCDQIRAFG